MSTVNEIKNNLSLLFERPAEPVFMAKGPNSVAFDIPNNFLPDRYQNIGAQLANRFDSENKVTVKNITAPDISIPLQLGRHEQFSLFIPSHAEMASQLTDIFMKAKDVDDLQSNAVYCRDRVNPYLFNYSLSVALLHRTDTRDVSIPNVASCFPDKYFDSGVFSRAREVASVVPDGSRQPIVIPRDNTATNLEPEQRIAYFREDLGINLHHWHWHLVYPFTAVDRAIVAKDRRGELFYYMHQQVLARYNAERFCNQLPRVGRLSNLREAIPEGYFPKLDSAVAGRSWPPRFTNTVLRDVTRDRLRIDISNIEQWIGRVRAAIAQGYVEDANQARIQLTEERGIDILGNLMEPATVLSPNRQLYGSIHNMGHLLIGYAHDPDGRFLEGFSVISDNATAMRDPVFYKWHAFLDEIFQLHKSSLPRYTVAQLSYPEVRVTGVQVEVQGGQPNRLQTFWQQSDIDMSRGLDFSPRGAVFVRFSHLQHQPFSYRIQVQNTSRNQMMGYVRIFMAPRVDERGRAMNFDEQRLFMIELDRFRVGLRSGQNVIVRRSDESSVTIPYETTFRNLANRPAAGTTAEQFNFCGCGWPQHMLIPKGTELGMQMELFVMISNYANDRVNQNLGGLCSEADSYCGILNRLYPDRQSMGYPFDRVGRNGVTSLAEFLTPNMIVQPVTITFRDETVVRANNNAVAAPDNANNATTTNRL